MKSRKTLRMEDHIVRYIENDTDSKPGDMVWVRVTQGFTYDVAAERLDEDELKKLNIE